MDAAGATRAVLDGLHPNSIGNGVMAEQAAARVLEWQRSQNPPLRRFAVVR